MKLAFVYGPFALGGRPFELPDVWFSPRGLTGSELSWFMLGFGMEEHGHQVDFLLDAPSCNGAWDPKKDRMLPVFDLRKADLDSYDAVLAWNEPDLLRRVSNPKVVRVVNQQLNDFGYCEVGFEEHVDLFTSPSAHHLERTSRRTSCAGKWRVLPNGCDPGLYLVGDKVPGRVVYASSPDRGLHLLLGAWRRVRKEVPHAHLRVFYRDLEGWANQFLTLEQHANKDYVELARRARYIIRGMWHADKLGIEVVGAVSRERMAREMSQAEVLAYPCDTFTYTEGFSVATMEGCASGALPVIAGADALGSIYGGWVPMVEGVKGEAGLDEWTGLVVRSLTDRDYAARWRVRARELAEQHRWAGLAARLEEMLLEAAGEKEQQASRMPPA